MQRRNGIAQHTPWKPERINISSCPALIFPRKLIETAFADAKQVDKETGQPTQLALDAVDWIMGKTDWTSLSVDLREELWRQPSPPEEIRQQFYGTFDWCCEALSFNPDEVRSAGLPHARLRNSNWKYDSPQRNSYNENPTVGGVQGIYATWKERRSRLRGVSSFVTGAGL